MSARNCWMFVLLLLVQAARLDAATASFNFSGSLTSVPSSLTSQLTVGQPFYGTYVIDFASSDVAAEPDIGRYLGSVSVLDVSVGSYVLTAASPGDVEVTNSAADGYIVTAIANGSAILGAQPLLSSIQLSDPSGTAFSSVAIPESVDLAKFFARDLTIDFSTGDRVVGHMDAIVVPEPLMTGWLWLLVGLLPRWGRRMVRRT